VALEDRRICRHLPQPKGRLWLARCRSPARPFCFTPNKALATPFSVRYAPLLAGRARRSLRVQPELQPLLSGNVMLKGITFIAAGEPVRHSTCIVRAQSSLGVRDAARDHPCCRSISRRPQSGRRIGAIACRRAPARRICLVRAVVAQERQQPLDRAAAPAALFEDPKVRCFSLQRDLRDADGEALRELPNLVHLGGELRDFADTAPSSRCSTSSSPSTRRLRIWPARWGRRS